MFAIRRMGSVSVATLNFFKRGLNEEKTSRRRGGPCVQSRDQLLNFVCVGVFGIFSYQAGSDHPENSFMTPRK